MQSVWVDGSTVLRSEAAVIDISLNGDEDLPRKFNDLVIGRQPLHPRSTVGYKGVLCRDFGFLRSKTATVKFLRIPMSQSTKHCFRVWWQEVPLHAQPQRTIW